MSIFGYKKWAINLDNSSVKDKVAPQQDALAKELKNTSNPAYLLSPTALMALGLAGSAAAALQTERAPKATSNAKPVDALPDPTPTSLDALTDLVEPASTLQLPLGELIQTMRAEGTTDTKEFGGSATATHLAESIQEVVQAGLDLTDASPAPVAESVVLAQAATGAAAGTQGAGAAAAGPTAAAGTVAAGAGAATVSASTVLLAATGIGLAAAGSSVSNDAKSNPNDTTRPVAPNLVLVSDTGISDTDKITKSGVVKVIGLESGATWEYSTNGGGSWIAGAGSTITLTGEGAKSVSARQTDAAGNRSANSEFFTFTLDLSTATPSVNAVATDDVVNAAEKAAGVTVTGTAEAGASVVVTWGAISKTVTATGGNWSASFLSGEVPADASTTISAVATDVAGNVSEVGARAVTVDTTAPATPTFDVVATDDIISAAERTATVTVSGTKEAGSTVTLNGQATTAVDATHWRYVLDAAAIDAFGQGPETLTAIATDAAGNVNAVNATKAITVDTVVPATPTFNVVATDDIVNAAERTATVTVTGTNEAGSTVTLNGQATIAVDATHWRHVLDAAAIDAFGQGPETLTAIATDANGNASAAGTKTITVDTVAPATPTFAVVATDDKVNAAEKAAGVTVSGTAEAGVSVLVIWGAFSKTVTATGGTWSTSFGSGEVPADASNTTISAVAADAAGNVNAVNATKIITVDTVAPTPPVIDVVATDNVIDAAERTATVTVTGTNEAGSTVTLNGQATIDMDATHWRYVLDTAAIDAFGQGPETLTAIASDAAGNASAAGTRDITVDTVAPLASQSPGPTSNSTGTIFEGQAGNDTLEGGPGYDQVQYASSPSAVTVTLSDTGDGTASDGFGGTDTLRSIEGVTGSAYNDSITGNSADNGLEGLGGNDTLVGGAGNDTLTGGAGADQLTGGDGNDVYKFGAVSDSSASSADLIIGFANGDTINLQAILGNEPGAAGYTSATEVVGAATAGSLQIVTDTGSFGEVGDNQLHLLVTNDAQGTHLSIKFDSNAAIGSPTESSTMLIDFQGDVQTLLVPAAMTLI